jgi:hypothetical protein
VRIRWKNLAPGRHYLDSGYLSAEAVVQAARSHGIALIGPLLADNSAQARAGGYTQQAFTIDFDRKQATCPEGAVSSTWKAPLEPMRDRSERHRRGRRVEHSGLIFGFRQRGWVATGRRMRSRACGGPVRSLGERCCRFRLSFRLSSRRCSAGPRRAENRNACANALRGTPGYGA